MPTNWHCMLINMPGHHLAASFYLQRLLPTFSVFTILLMIDTWCQSRFCNDILMFPHVGHCSQTEDTFCIKNKTCQLSLIQPIALPRKTNLYLYKSAQHIQ